MQFIKKNYEKILLGVVLLGLVVVAVFMLLRVSQERQAQEDRRNKIIRRSVRPLDPVDLAMADALVRRAELPMALNFSDNTNRLLNPVRWQKTADGRIIKNPVGSDLERLEVTSITPLYLTVSYDSVRVSETGARYVILVEQQAAKQIRQRSRRSHYLSVGEKAEFGEGKETMILREVTGATNDPAALVLELSNVERPITISKESPFRRVEGYSASLRFPPENRNYPNRRVDDVITIAGEQYNIVAITENEVVLSASSNQKKWTIKHNPGE
jgi:hypothetical protein